MCRRIFRSARLFGAVVAIGLFAGQVVADDSPKLGYGFQKDREYAYNVKIVADLPDEELTSEGVYSCKILDAQENQFTLKASGGLSEQAKPKPGASVVRGRRPGPPRMSHRIPPPPFGRFAQPTRPAGTTVGRQGNLIIEGNMTALPFLLGYAEMLFIEPFPKEPKAAWDTQTGLGVIERNQSSWHHIGPFSETEVAHGASERIDFSVLETKPDAVRISKNYTLHTNPDSAGSTQIDMTGNGEFEFDRGAGVIKSQTMKYVIRLSERNVNVTIPFTLTFRLMSAAEAADYKKKREEAMAAAAEAAKPHALPAAERAQLLKDLQSGNPMRVMPATIRLRMSIRDDHPEDISRVLCRMLKTSDHGSKHLIMEALKVWAAADAEKTVLAAAKDPDFFVRSAAIEALANFKSAAAAQIAAAALAEQETRQAAVTALKAIGPVAEPYVIPYLDHHDVFVRGDAESILGDIGGKKSVAALKAELAKAAWHEKDKIQQLIATIEARLESGGDDTAAAGPAGAATAAAPAADVAEAKTRTWHDVTGTYQIDAALVSSAGGNVTLKRTDGKEITLPLAKLSAEDRAFVEKNARPPNPFE